MALLRRVLQIQRRRKARQELSAYDALITTPGSLVTGVTLPGNGPLSASVAAVLAAPTVVIDVTGGRAIGLPAGASGAVAGIGWFETGRKLTKAAGAPGVVSVYVEDGFGKRYKIAEG